MSKCDVTVTGVDMMTDLDALPKGVEYAVLYSETSENRKRCPEKSYVAYLLRDMANLGHKCAVHICGNQAKKALAQGKLWDVVCQVGRIQVNGFISTKEVDALCSLYRPHKIIIQAHEENTPVLSMVKHRNLEVLVDGSGGRGRLPSRWVRPITSLRVGFAGGLNPGNVGSELKRIHSAAGGVNYWIDVETGVRDEDDWMDVGLVREFVAAAK